jgi:hypothetical protein
MEAAVSSETLITIYMAVRSMNQKINGCYKSFLSSLCKNTVSPRYKGCGYDGQI